MIRRIITIVLLLIAGTAIAGPNRKPKASANLVTGFGTTDHALIITLDGSKSYDPDGTIVNWKWYQIGVKPTPVIFSKQTDPKTTAAPAIWIVGVYAIVLQCTDNDGGIGRDTVTVTVNNNKPPVISLGQNKMVTIAAGGCADVDITASIADPEKKPLKSISWAVPGATFVTNGAYGIRINNLRKGIFIARVTVGDADGAVVSGQVTITVTERSCQWWEKWFTDRCKCK